MRSYGQRIEPINLSRSFKLSFVVHILFLGSFFVKTSFFPSEDIVLKRSIRVDLVGMPDKVPQKKPRAKKAVKKKKPPKKKVIEKVKLKKAKSSKTKSKIKTPKVDRKATQKKALDKLKALAALEHIKDDIKEEAEADRSVKKVLEKFQYKGEAINSGSGMTGFDQIKFDQYLEALEKQLYAHWRLPPWLSNEDLKAQVRIYVDNRGFVIRKELSKSSGNDIFDKKVLEAIAKASPLEKPPGRLADRLKSGGLYINFP